MMNPPSTTGGSIPLQEYRRDVPPGWQPGDPSYPLRSYFEKMRLWYRVSNVEDESVGPLLAGRLYGRAAKVAMTLKIPRPDGRFDTGDAALARLSVDEVLDPTTGAVIQQAIPSGVQFLVDALRRAFGQQDQDLATEALEKFFSLQRGKLSLAEYAVEFDTRLDEASDRAGLQLNDVGKFFLWFKHSGMSTKVIDDIKLQVGGDYNRFQDARTLALRMSPNRSDRDDTTIFYEDNLEESYNDNYGYDDSWNQDQWHGYEATEEGEWVYETDDTYYQDWSEEADEWQNFYEDETPWNYEEPWTSSYEAETQPTTSGAAKTEETFADQETYYKGKGKSKDGCFNCGSKWHQVRDCPMKSEKGKGHAYQSKGKFGGKGKGFRGRWTWRPSSWKGKGKGKFGYRGGFKGGFKGKSKKGHWFMTETSGPTSERTLNVQDGNIQVLGTTDRIDRSHTPEAFIIHSSSEDDIMKVRRAYAATSANEATSSEEPATAQKQTKNFDTATWNFMFLAGEACSYFQVRGQERKGLLIDPGAASGLIGSETLRMSLKECAVDTPQFEFDKTTPVSGISGTSSSTLGQVTVPLRVGSVPITYTAEVLGGDGSLCPALVGNPTLRKLNATIFANWFDNGDGLMTMDGRQDEGTVAIKFFRLLLTESGHYILPTDNKESQKVHYMDKNKAILFSQKVALASEEQWNDLHPRVRHCFLGRTLPQARAEGDRCENMALHSNVIPDDKMMIAHHAAQELPGQRPSNDNEQKQTNLPDAVQHPHDAVQHTAQALREESDQINESHDHTADGHPILDSQTQTAEKKQFHSCTTIHEEAEDDDGNPKPANFTPSAILASEQESSDRYDHDVLPAEHDHLDVSKLNKRYKAIPEEYYTRSGLTPVTPGNFKSWFSKTRGRGLRWHAWELCSGSGRLSLCLLMAGLVVGFPVDYRYGWDINNAQHQSYLNQAYHEFKPGVVHAAPDCAPWSVSANTKDPRLRHQDRLRDRPGLQWLQEIFEKQDRQARGYNLEQPHNSAMWQEHLPENPVRLSRIKGNRSKQRVDQCMHGACDECQNPIKKSTSFGSNMRWNRCALRCSGHRGRAHSHLQGTGPNGLSRTSMAAVYPQTLCQRMKNDIIGYLNNKDLIDIGKWPDDCYHSVITHMYECVRCQLGRACPKSIERSLIPGQCRHGKWPPGESPKEKAKADADPLTRWKNETRKEVLDTVDIKNMSSYGGFHIEDMHFLKKLLMETVHAALGLFDEALQQKKEYMHWIDDPVHMSLYKEIFGGVLVVKGVKVSLRPFTDGTAEPKLPMVSSYLRLHVYGHVKEWKIMPVHDLREMSHSQIHQAIDIDDWLITIYGVETAAVPAPSTPASRPRTRPEEPPMPPKPESLSLPRLMDRPADEKAEDAIVETIYEDAELDNDTAIKVMQWAADAYSMLDKSECHGCILGKALRHLQPPKGTVGHLITWIHGGVNYAIQEHNSDNNMIMKKITNYAREDICIMYLFRYVTKISEDMERSSQKMPTTSLEPMQVTPPHHEGQEPEDMDVERHGEKREGPDSRTVTIAPERKKQKTMLVKKDLEFLRHYFIATNKDRLVQLGFPENWKNDYNLMMTTTRKFLIKQYDERRKMLPELFHIEYKQNHFAYANLLTGEIYKVDQETNNIEDEDITPAIWKELDEADRNEVKQFVDEKAFKKIHKSQVTNDMVEIDCRWVRKYKRYPDKTLRIKSRLCARGCLDSQKAQLTTRSTTATRLSQRILVSHAARCKKRTLESLDIAGAFLKGFNFDEIRRTLMKRGMNAPERTVIVYPPANVWRHLKELDSSFTVPYDDYTQYGLLCCKPIYGLNDAPLAWQFCLHDFIMAQGATSSHLDENCWTWKENNEPIAMLTTHVDDLAISATPEFMNDIYNKFVTKFKKVTRQQLPFDHCGCEYSRTGDGYFIGQKEFAKRMKPAAVPDRADDSPLNPPEVSDLRSILGALLWITATRLDVIADVSLLQSRVTKAEVQDIKNANEVLRKVVEHADMGLHYRFFKHKAKRLAVIHDASAASKGRSYAQEGVIICLTDDAWQDTKISYEHTCTTEEDDDKHGGVMHVLYSHGAKSKRISYSTSHGETLAMVNALEAATLCMIRLSEITHSEKKPSLQQLIAIQSQGNACLPMDMYCDARDVFELVTGLVKMYGVKDHPIISRVLPTARDFSENDLQKDDKEIYEKFGEKAKVSFATFLLGLITKNKLMMFMLAMSSAAQAHEFDRAPAEEDSEMWSIYMLILYTIVVAMAVQLVMHYILKKKESKPKMMVKEEPSSDDAMEVDFEASSKNRKRARELIKEQDIEKLKDKIASYEDLTEKLQRSKEQNKTSADDWYRRYQDAKDDLDAAKTERDDAREDRDKHRSMLYEEYNKQVDLRNKIETLENQLQTEKDRLDGMKKAYDLAEKRNKDLEKRLVEAEREAKMTRSLAPIPSPSTPQSAVIQVEKEKFPERVYITGNGTKYHSEGCHHLSSLAKAYTKCMHCTR
ncbi:1-alkyl-2-acetylglycerophosphocholine esterase [Durusdinium trenchii]|uniref:1-alkyl-2-acetylglycerophosphocholine esterase n=1 Tax=Durusdinium trenchii TaxID=1381693 RepID=A0ABP0Q9F1_9DINO